MGKHDRTGSSAIANSCQMRGNRTSLGVRESRPGSQSGSSEEDDSDENKSPVSVKDRGRKDLREGNEKTTTTTTTTT